uniref:AAA+ ATPase domain-containing protein n=1 Tax=viral metagenome TaxID=1070528 RepID=A0A6C0HIC9_9ZZZZ
MSQTINSILNRDTIAMEIKLNLLSFEENCKNINYKKGFYVYGSPGCGKTHFVIDILTELNYDIIKYDAGDIRNKSLIDTITSNNMSNQNVLQMMSKTRKKIAIVMDEIDGMNNGDKGGITSLIKLIRQKKTKKQKAESMTLNPIICIGNYFVDKKIKELMKVCNTYELKTATPIQITTILDSRLPQLDSSLKPDIVRYIQGDMRKLFFVEEIYRLKPQMLNAETISHIFHTKSFNEDSKKITQTLLNDYIPIDKHNVSMNETDRTIVALLWHENIVDHLTKIDTQTSFPFYLKILDNMCFADYIDRITFQNQIWQFNEMSSMIKTFHNNKMYHDQFHHTISPTAQSSDIRFTKVLTKYSTEYNNSLFIFGLTQTLDMDKKDLISFFQELRLYYGVNFFNEYDKINEVEKMFESYGINKLDIKRMYRYLDKNVKKENVEEEEEETDAL